MSRNSAKSAGRSTKTGRRTTKKTTKSARSSVKKTTKTGRRPTGKSSRSTATRAKVAQKKSPLTSAASIKSVPEIVLAKSPPVQPVQPVQPAAPKPMPVRAHKYQVGEMVYYTSPSFGRTAASGNYTIVKLLPSESDDYQYRIKGNGEAFERVAKESQLEKA